MKIQKQYEQFIFTHAEVKIYLEIHYLQKSYTLLSKDGNAEFIFKNTKNFNGNKILLKLIYAAINFAEKKLKGE